MNPQTLKIPQLPDLRGLIWSSFIGDLSRLNEIGQPIAQSASRFDDPISIAHACLKRAVGIVAGTEALIDIGLSTEAMSLGRGLLEVEMVLRAMVVKPDDIREKLLADWREGRRGHAKEVATSLRATQAQKNRLMKSKTLRKMLKKKDLILKNFQNLLVIVRLTLLTKNTLSMARICL